MDHRLFILVLGCIIGVDAVFRSSPSLLRSERDISTPNVFSNKIQFGDGSSISSACPDPNARVPTPPDVNLSDLECSQTRTWPGLVFDGCAVWMRGAGGVPASVLPSDLDVVVVDGNGVMVDVSLNLLRPGVVGITIDSVPNVSRLEVRAAYFGQAIRQGGPIAIDVGPTLTCELISSEYREPYRQCVIDASNGVGGTIPMEEFTLSAMVAPLDEVCNAGCAYAPTTISSLTPVSSTEFVFTVDVDLRVNFGGAGRTMWIGVKRNGEHIAKSPSENTRLEFGEKKDIPAWSCLHVLESFSSEQTIPKRGLWWIEPVSLNFGNAVLVMCDLEKGGFTLGIVGWYLGSNVRGPLGGSFGNVSNGVLEPRKQEYKLDDAIINALVGPKFDMMVDQVGFHAVYSNGPFEYVVVHNYQGPWTFMATVIDDPNSYVTVHYTETHDIIWGPKHMPCGTQPFGVSCSLGSNYRDGPQGGANCAPPRFSHATKYSYNYFYLGTADGNTALYMCNGPQHSSSSNSITHRVWFRESQG